ncbi:MAG: hypothetical protein KBT65_07490, partial [Sulfitobacter sp.]|nr:hypothetical protein [Sulfitobacter sp.]
QRYRRLVELNLYWRGAEISRPANFSHLFAVARHPTRAVYPNSMDMLICTLRHGIRQKREDQRKPGPVVIT